MTAFLKVFLAVKIAGREELLQFEKLKGGLSVSVCN